MCVFTQGPGGTTLAGAPVRNKVTTFSVQKKYRRQEKLTMVTAYDYPSVCVCVCVCVCGVHVHVHCAKATVCISVCVHVSG